MSDINIIIFEDFKSPEELHKFMDNFQYGFKYKTDNNIKYITPDDKEFNDPNFEKRLRTQKSKELEKSHIGMCYDQSMYAHYHLKKMGYKPKTIFTISKPKGQDGYKSHSTIVYKDKDGYKNFEHAWSQHSRIHGPFKTHQDCVNDIIKRFKDTDDEEVETHTHINLDKLINTNQDLTSDYVHKVFFKSKKYNPKKITYKI